MRAGRAMTCAAAVLVSLRLCLSEHARSPSARLSRPLRGGLATLTARRPAGVCAHAGSALRNANGYLIYRGSVSTYCHLGNLFSNLSFLSFQLGNIRHIRNFSFFHHAGGGGGHDGELCVSKVI